MIARAAGVTFQLPRPTTLDAASWANVGVPSDARPEQVTRPFLARYTRGPSVLCLHPHTREN